MLPGKALTPAEIIGILRRRIWLIVVPPVLTLFAALVYSSGIANVYESDMLIAVDPQRVPDAFVRSTVTLGTDRRMEAISVQVLSRTNLEQMVEQLDLYPAQRKSMPIEDVVAKMRRDISVELERSRGQEGPTAFHVRFTHSDPAVAARVTQQLGSLFVKQNTTDRASLATATNGFLEGQLGDARKRLEAQEQRLEAFRQQHGKALPTQMQANLQALQSLQLQVQATVESIARERDRKQLLDRLYRDAATEPAPTLRSGPSTAAGGDATPAGASAQQRLAAARQQLAGLEIRYTADHPDVARAKRLIAELEPMAAAEASKPTPAGQPSDSASTQIEDPAQRERLRQMRAEMESIDRQIAFKESEERRLRSEITDYQSRVDAVPGLESEWAALTRDYDTQQVEYKELLTKSGNARVAAALEEQQIGESFRIVDPARIPVHPVPSIRARVNVAGLAVGLALGLGVVLLLELRDATFRTESDVMEVLGLPVLVSVPFVETASERARRQSRTRLLAGTGVACVALMGYVTWTMKLWNSLT